MTEDEIKAQEEANALAAEEKAKQEAEEAARIKAEAKAKAEVDDDDKHKSKVDDEKAKLLKEVMKLKEKAKAEEEARKKLEETYKGIDLEAARAALKAAEEAEEKELEKKGEYERLLNKQKEKAEALIEAERNRATEMEKKLQDAMKAVDELSLGNAFSSSKFIQDKMALTPNKTRALYGSHFEVEDGKLIAYDKPRGSTDRTKLINATGEAVPFEDAISEIVNSDPDKEYLLKADTKSGAGSKGSHVRGDNRQEEQLDSVSKIAAGLKSDKNFGPSSIG
jgi:hypothetical protein